MTKINSETGPIDVNLIDLLEERLSINLPCEYRDFLTLYNGGYPDPDGFLFKDGSDGSSVDFFFDIGTSAEKSIEGTVRRYKNRIPESFLPIARDPGGNLVLIKLYGAAAGSIFFWDHEAESDSDHPSASNISLISNSFNEFIKNLYEIDVG